jgi:nucleotide-binding universal stress UspA family protein
MSDPVTILHPTDFSDAAEAAEVEAIRLARALDATLVLFHVCVEAPLYRESPWGVGELEKVYAEQARWAESELADRVKRLAKDGVKATWRRCTGVPHEAIVQIATEERASYVVMGTHGRGRLGRLLLGSVADRVVRTAPCPVLTVRVPEDVAPPLR